MDDIGWIVLPIQFDYAWPAMSEKKKLILKPEQVVSLLGGLQALGGYDRVIKDGAGERVVHDTYKLGAGLRRVIGKNIAELMRVNADTVEAQRALIAEYGMIDKGSTVEAKYNVELMRLLEMRDEVELITISAGELDEHLIPGPVLGVLDDILED